MQLGVDVDRVGEMSCMMEESRGGLSSRLISEEAEEPFQFAGTGMWLGVFGRTRGFVKNPPGDWERDGGRLMEDRVVEPLDAVIGDHGLEEAKELRDMLLGWLGVTGAVEGIGGTGG